MAAVDLASTWATVAGRRMHARVAGAGPPVVLVHGVGVSGRYFEPLAEQLAATHRVFIPDLPGFGKSDGPTWPLDVPGLADSLAAWLRQGPGRVPLVGNSLGCQVIVDLAVRYPELAEPAVLIGPTTDPWAGNVIALLARGVITLPHESPALYPILVTDYVRAGPLRTLATLQAGADDPLLAKLPRVRQPVLVVRGVRDLIAPRRWVKAVAECLPHGRWAEVPAAAHAAHFSRPELVAELVRELLDRK